MRSKLVLSFICASVCVGIQAETSKLTYNDCLKKIFQSNKNIKTAKLDLLIAEHDAKYYYSGFLPTLTFSSDYTDTHLTTKNPSKKIYSNSIELTQNLFSGFQDYYKLSAALIEKEEVKNNLTKEKINQRSELKIAFANLALAQRLYKYSKDLIKTRESIKDLVALKFSSGNETKDSLLFAEGEIESAKLDLMTAEHSIAAGKRKLREILGEDLGDDFEVAGEIPKEEIPEDLDFKKMSMESLEFQNASLAEKKAQEEMKEYRGKFLPSVDFSVSRERERKRNYSETTYNRNYYTIYKLSVSLPLFEGFGTYHEYKSAELASDKEKINAVKVYEEQFMNLKETYERYLELQKKKKIYQQFVEAAKMKEKINTSKYRLGLVTFDIWIDAQNNLIDYQKNLIEIDYEIEANLAKWQALVSKRV